MIIFSNTLNVHFIKISLQMQNVWFDRMAISNRVPEHVKSVDSMCQNVSELIEKEVAEGIPYNRIILGGFSMGGCLALHLAYRYKTTVAGCFAMSSFLNKESVIYEVHSYDISIDSLFIYKFVRRKKIKN